VERLESTGTVVGLFKEWSCGLAHCRMEPGDLLALYTDGVTEAFDEAEEEYGEVRLVEALRRHAEKSPESMVATVVDEVGKFGREQHDDITLIVARCREGAAIA
jgi:serine phosphatase RsbU (regulator of sigma subunit)